MGVRTADADFLQRLDEIDRIIVMFLEPRRDGEDIGVEDDVLCREADAGQQLVGALAYLDLAFFRVGLPNLVERHHDPRRAVSPALARLVEERLLPSLDRKSVG